MDKEIIESKEIIKSNERWCKIKTRDCEVVISSPYIEDSMESLTNNADKLISKHSNIKRDDKTYIK